MFSKGIVLVLDTVKVHKQQTATTPVVSQLSFIVYEPCALKPSSICGIILFGTSSLKFCWDVSVMFSKFETVKDFVLCCVNCFC